MTIRRKTRRRVRLHGGQDSDLKPLSFFLRDVKTEEEYDALSKEDQLAYETRYVIPAVQQILTITPTAEGKDGKAYYANLAMTCVLLLKNTLTTRPYFFITVKRKVEEFRKEKDFTELQATLDKVEALLNKINTQDLLMEYLNSDNIQMLNTMLPEVKKRSEQDIMIMLTFFYGSDALFDVMKRSNTTYNPRRYNNSGEIFINHIPRTLDKTIFADRLLAIIPNNVFYGLTNTLVYLVEIAAHLPESELWKLTYFLEAVGPKKPEIYPFLHNIIDFRNYPKGSKILLHTLIDKNIRLANVFSETILRITVKWIFENEPDRLLGYFNLFDSKTCYDILESLGKDTVDMNPKIVAVYIESMIGKKCHASPKVLKYVVSMRLVEPLTHLLETGDFKDMVEDVLDVAATPEIRELLLKYATISMWEGWSRADAAQFDFLFSDEGATNYSVCPVCLKFVQRSDGCLYMSHDCASLPGFYHKRLYEMYAWSADEPEDENNDQAENEWNEDDEDNWNDRNDPRIRGEWEGGMRGGSQKKITWCTDCGRICYGHQHYELNSATATTKPKKLPHGDPFDKDCRKSNSGGGYPEKVARYRRAREYALELQEDVGKVTRKAALEDLVEQIWNAPLYKTRAVNRIIREKAWNIPTERFPAPSLPKNGTNSANTYPNIPRPAANVGLLPTYAAEGENAIAMNSDVPVVFFHHRLPDGSVKDHKDDGEGVGLPTLLQYVKDMNAAFGTDMFGACPFQCGARLHPDELAKAFELLGDSQTALVAEYRAKYNRRFR